MSPGFKPRPMVTCDELRLLLVLVLAPTIALTNTKRATEPLLGVPGHKQNPIFIQISRVYSTFFLDTFSWLRVTKWLIKLK